MRCIACDKLLWVIRTEAKTWGQWRVRKCVNGHEFYTGEVFLPNPLERGPYGNIEDDEMETYLLLKRKAREVGLGSKEGA